MQNPTLAAHLQAQLTAVFEAIADGRKTVRIYPEPRRDRLRRAQGRSCQAGLERGRFPAVYRRGGSGAGLPRKGLPAGARLVRSPFRDQGHGHAAAVVGGDHKTRGRRLDRIDLPKRQAERVSQGTPRHENLRLFPSPESCPVRAVGDRRACRRPVGQRAPAPIAPDNRQRQGEPESGHGKDPNVVWLALLFSRRSEDVSHFRRRSKIKSSVGLTHDFPSCRNKQRASRTRER